MARTRNASAAFHRDAGQALDKEGKPLNVNPHGAPTLPPIAPKLLHMDDGEIVPPKPKDAPPAPVSVSSASAYLCDRTTWQRNMEAFEALLLIEALVGPMSVTLTPEQWSARPPDARRHFRRIQAPAPAIAAE